MIYEGRRSSRSNCAFFFERGSRRAENVSSNEARVIHSPLIARLVFQTRVPYPRRDPAKFVMGMHLPRCPSRSSLFAKDYRQRIAIKLDRRWMSRWIDRSIDRNAAKRTLWSVIDNERGGDDALKRALCPLLFNEDPIRVVMGADLYRS